MHNTNDMKIKNTTVHERSTIKYQNLKKKDAASIIRAHIYMTVQLSGLAQTLQ
jgi:hypothetical protein